MSNETKILTGIGIVTAIIIIIAAFTLGGKPTNTSNTQSKLLAEDKSKFLVRPDSHILGPKDAKVTIVEFGDFQCPACGSAHPIVKKVEKEYEGKIKLVFRNFPLTGVHSNAQIAAEAAEAAGVQKKFWEMLDMLYTNQKDWSDSKEPLAFFVKYAEELELNADQFKKDIIGNKHASKIQQDVNDANALNVNSTPTFFINNQMESGILSFENFQKKIDPLLKTN